MALYGQLQVCQALATHLRLCMGIDLNFRFCGYGTAVYIDRDVTQVHRKFINIMRQLTVARLQKVDNVLSD